MTLICVLGHSGSGKSAVEKGLEEVGFNRIISYTTREPRGREENGVDYNFVSREDFLSLLDKGILMEHAEYRGNLYGAPKPVGGLNHVIVVEAKGYETIREMYGDQVIGVYIDVDEETIRNRIINRSDTSIEEANIRVEEDKNVFANIKDKVDIIVDGRKPINTIIQTILEFKQSRENRINK